MSFWKKRRFFSFAPLISILSFFLFWSSEIFSFLPANISHSTKQTSLSSYPFLFFHLFFVSDKRKKSGNKSEGSSERLEFKRRMDEGRGRPSAHMMENGCYKEYQKIPFYLSFHFLVDKFRSGTLTWGPSVEMLRHMSKCQGHPHHTHSSLLNNTLNQTGMIMKIHLTVHHEKYFMHQFLPLHEGTSRCIESIHEIFSWSPELWCNKKSS